MAILQSVNITINTSAPPVGEAGFGIPLWAGALPAFTPPERVRVYATNQAAQADDDLSATAKAAIAVAFGQTLVPTAVAAGRVEADQAQVITFTFSGTPEIGDKMQVTVNSVLTDYTVASAVLNTEVDALRAAMVTALAAQPVTVAGSSPDITVTADVAGDPFTYLSAIVLVGSGDLAVSEAETAENRSVSTELDDILRRNSSWYGLMLESRVALQIQRAAAWGDSNGRLLIGQNNDADCLTTADTDICTTLKDLNILHAAVLYIALDTQYGDAAWLGKTLPVDPDLKVTTWAQKTLAQVSVQDLSDTELANLVGKNGNTYGTLGGVGATTPGRAANGIPIDIVLTIDWMDARITEGIQQLLLDASNRGERVNFDDDGIRAVAQVIEGVIALGQDVGHINTDETSVIFNIPTRAEIPSADVTARTLNLSFVVEATGAIENVIVNGTVVADI